MPTQPFSGTNVGQIPGMPVSYGDPDPEWEEAIEAALSALKSAQEEGSWAVHQGRMLAGNSFVTEHNVKDTREAFDTALSTDMETTAIAQICSNYDVSFMAVRCISDFMRPSSRSGIPSLGRCGGSPLGTICAADRR